MSPNIDTAQMHWCGKTAMIVPKHELIINQINHHGHNVDEMAKEFREIRMAVRASRMTVCSMYLENKA